LSDDPKDRVAPSSYTQFVSAAMEFLVARPNANVLIIVESATGLETFRSVSSPVWNLGALNAAQVQFSGILAAMSQQVREKAEAIENDEQDRIERSLKRDKEKAN
jgi:hypothetical protein